ncbi:MAG: ribonuclease HII, partial [Candidatus Eisenbacteria bacterium]
MTPGGVYSSEITGRLLDAIRAETAFLCPPDRPRPEKQSPDLEIALGWRKGRRIAGVDEAGRGPLAGPVVAAAVRLHPERVPPGLDDSKKLSPEARARLFSSILRSAEDVGIGLVTEEGVDRWNVREAAREAMIRAARALVEPADWVLVDGIRLDPFPFRQVAVIGGDRLVPSIAAASIVAKVVRDRLMSAYSRLFPLYGFDRHKGYPTGEHARAIAAHGPSLIHRRTFHVPICSEGATGEEGAGKADRRRTGERGEETAARHLEGRGYRIRARNYRTRRGEIDLVAERGREIVFVEVRFRRSEAYGVPAETVDGRKRLRIARAAAAYLVEHGLTERPCRFDLVALTA